MGALVVISLGLLFQAARRLALTGLCGRNSDTEGYVAHACADIVVDIGERSISTRNIGGDDLTTSFVALFDCRFDFGEKLFFLSSTESLGLLWLNHPPHAQRKIRRVVGDEPDFQ